MRRNWKQQQISDGFMGDSVRAPAQLPSHPVQHAFPVEGRTGIDLVRGQVVVADHAGEVLVLLVGQHAGEQLSVGAARRVGCDARQNAGDAGDQLDQ